MQSICYLLQEKVFLISLEVWEFSFIAAEKVVTFYEYMFWKFSWLNSFM